MAIQEKHYSQCEVWEGHDGSVSDRLVQGSSTLRDTCHCIVWHWWRDNERVHLDMTIVYITHSRPIRDIPAHEPIVYPRLRLRTNRYCSTVSYTLLHFHYQLILSLFFIFCMCVSYYIMDCYLLFSMYYILLCVIVFIVIYLIITKLLTYFMTVIRVCWRGTSSRSRRLLYDLPPWQCDQWSLSRVPWTSWTFGLLRLPVGL